MILIIMSILGLFFNVNAVFLGYANYQSMVVDLDCSFKEALKNHFKHFALFQKRIKFLVLGLTVVGTALQIALYAVLYRYVGSKVQSYIVLGSFILILVYMIVSIVQTIRE